MKSEISLHPNVYATGQCSGLLSMLEQVWIREHTSGDGTIFLVSGFANFNGGVRFFESFRNHVDKGGELVVVLGGSANSRLSSKQIVEELLKCGAKVTVVNRKSIFHAKFYGSKKATGDSLVVTSGNFTGPGMSQNVEMSVLLSPEFTEAASFSWEGLMRQLFLQKWDFHTPHLSDLLSPSWKLLYDEKASDIKLEDDGHVTLLLKLVHSDTVRINAAQGSIEAKGTQYFWLSKDCFDFFPPLTIKNRRGVKPTYSCYVNLAYVDLQIVQESLVTFESGNNLDFRLGTGALRYSRVAKEGDLVAITRIGESSYQMRFYKNGSPRYLNLIKYAINFVGNRGKQYGFIPNRQFMTLIGLQKP